MRKPWRVREKSHGWVIGHYASKDAAMQAARSFFRSWESFPRQLRSDFSYPTDEEVLGRLEVTRK